MSNSEYREAQQQAREALKTPEEWCRIEGVEILDPDGWRGRNSRPWTDPVSLAEFQERLIVCTMRHVTKPDDRAEFKARRDAGLAKRHEQRLENATYTAAEVKVLTEAALRLGRKEAGEEIAAAIDAAARECLATPKKCHAVDAKLAREIGSQPSPDAFEPRIDPGMGMDLPPEPQAVREPQEDA